MWFYPKRANYREVSFCYHIIDNVLVQAKINPTASYFIIAVLFVWSLHWFCACCKWPEENPFFGSSTQFALGSHPAGAKIHERLRTFDAFRKSGLFSGVINQACQMVQILVVHHFAPDICRYLGPSFIRSEWGTSLPLSAYAFLFRCIARWLRIIGFHVVQNIINCLQKSPHQLLGARSITSIR